MEKILSQLITYESNYLEEMAFKDSMLRLLQTEKNKAFDRQLISGHFTASAWILSHDQEKALLLHHKKLNRWLQAGGHADGMMDLETVARKEAAEETGLNELKLLSDNIFDLDIHEIPAKGAVISHLHYDVRYLFSTALGDTVTINEESNHFKWVSLEQLIKEINNPSILRMVQKSLNLRP